jgi:hypothetical protein
MLGFSRFGYRVSGSGFQVSVLGFGVWEEIDEVFVGLQQHYAVMDAHDVQVLSQFGFRVSGSGFQVSS